MQRRLRNQRLQFPQTVRGGQHGTRKATASEQTRSPMAAGRGPARCVQKFLHRMHRADGRGGHGPGSTRGRRIRPAVRSPPSTNRLPCRCRWVRFRVRIRMMPVCLVTVAMGLAWVLPLSLQRLDTLGGAGDGDFFVGGHDPDADAAVGWLRRRRAVPGAGITLRSSCTPNVCMPVQTASRTSGPFRRSCR